jgi:hypothetical protein
VMVNTNRAAREEAARSREDSVERSSVTAPDASKTYS